MAGTRKTCEASDMLKRGNTLWRDLGVPPCIRPATVTVTVPWQDGEWSFGSCAPCSVLFTDVHNTQAHAVITEGGVSREAHRQAD